MRRILLFTILLCGSFLSGAQNMNYLQFQKLMKVDGGFQGIGASYETRLGKNKTIDFALGVGGSYHAYDGGISYDLILDDPSVYLSVTPKFYYNRQRRINKGKNIELNSGNYIGLRAKFVTAPVFYGYYSDDAILFNIHWGIQRALGKRWIFNTHVGIGCMENVDYPPLTVYPVLDVKFAYVFWVKRD